MATSKQYNTKQREVILRCLSQNTDRHLTADEISALLAKSDCKVGKATVYRYLERLTDEGKIRRYMSDSGGSACYQMIDDSCHEHFHLKCIGCGRIIHVECDFLSEMSDHLMNDHSFEIDVSRITIYGRCENCRTVEEK